MSSDIASDGFAQARKNMVDCQVRPSDVTRLSLIDAMMWAPREIFVPVDRRPTAYIGEAIALTKGRFELDPRVFAKMADTAQPRQTDLALVIGSGMGYAAAVLSKMVATVVALEEDESLAAAGRTAFSELEANTVLSETGPLAQGCPAHAPFDLIFINGGAETVPTAIYDQLAEDGRLVSIKMNGDVGRCELSVKIKGIIGSRPVFDAAAAVLPGFERPAAFKF
ncbi:MAG: protein-L-isoaspartate O-methyltransferase [Neomegalonema sp.]|nr:protein-L-isoaspartate O-methyltransferase [Neomegalonema sp.]